MFQRALNRLRGGVRNRRYVMTIHAVQEMDEDGLSIDDIERVILTGERVERQKNGLTSEGKYRIAGRAAAAQEVEVVARFGPTGKVVILTVYVV